jgi:hypothetical protein
MMVLRLITMMAQSLNAAVLLVALLAAPIVMLVAIMNVQQDMSVQLIVRILILVPLALVLEWLRQSVPLVPI